MTLEEIKDKYCIEKFGHHYDNAVYRGLVRDFQHDEIAKRYASAKLEERPKYIRDYEQSLRDKEKELNELMLEYKNKNRNTIKEQSKN